MTKSYLLSPAIYGRVSEFVDELRALSEQVAYLADTEPNHLGSNLLSGIQQKIENSYIALAEVGGVDIRLDDFLPLPEAVPYFLPQSLMHFKDTTDYCVPLLKALGNNQNNQNDQGKSLAYDYLAFTLENYGETAKFLEETILEELPPHRDVNKCLRNEI